MSGAGHYYSYVGSSIIIALAAWVILWRRQFKQSVALDFGRMLIVLSIILTTCYSSFVVLKLLIDKLALGNSQTQALWIVAGLLAYFAGGQAVVRLRALMKGSD